MLYISTQYNDISIFNIALKILDSNPHRVNTVSKLIDKITKSNLPFDLVVENAQKLLQFGLITQVKAILNVIDLAKLRHLDPEKLQKTGSQLAVILPYHSDVTILMNFFDLLSKKYKLDDDVIIDLKLKAVAIVIMIGNYDSAKMILQSIVPKKLMSNDNLTFLGIHYISLSMFNEAVEVFEIADSKEKIEPSLVYFKAISQMCIGNMNGALSIIDNAIKIKSDEPKTLLWKAKLNNYLGQYSEALIWIEKAFAELTPESPLNTICYCLTEKGITLKSLGEIDSSLKCFRKAIALRHNGKILSWNACFEYAMTLLSIGKLEEASSVISKGCQIRYPSFSNDYNPCHVLKCFLSFKPLNEEENYNLLQKMEYFYFWPWPFLPYRIWALILIGGMLEKQLLYNETTQLYQALYRLGFYGATDHEYSNFVPKIDTRDGIFYNQELLDILQTRLWSNDYNWTIIRQLFL